jgi:hypothetical protein
MRIDKGGAVIAALAALHQVVLESVPTNDDFVHLALSRQLLGGDLPVRDFFDSGLTLQYGLSAAAQGLFGHRLLAESVVVAIAFAVSTYAVFGLVRILTGSPLAASCAAVLLLLAGPRGYSYPKIVVYAVAALLWWAYTWKPTRTRVVALGAWTALAFYWRPDHGVYVAAGLVLAMVAAHGVRPLAFARTALGAATSIALVLPFLLLVATTVGVITYVRSGFLLARTQHTELDSHAWPKWPLHRWSDVVRLAPAEEFAPVVGLRWADGSTAAARRAAIQRHQAVALEADGVSQHVRLADASPRAILALINDPLVADTAGIDRSSAAVPVSEWPLWERWRFRHAWLRLRVFPGIDDQRAASEAAAAAFYVLPLVALVIMVPLRRHLGASVGVPVIVAFCAFAAIVNLGLLRTPYDVRAVDGVVMPAILIGGIVGVLLASAASAGTFRRGATVAVVLVVVVFAVKTVAVSGQFGDRVGWVAGDWRSVARMRGAWADVGKRLVASPPLSYWDDARAPLSIRLARYANTCVPPSERLAVLWFAPEIYYYADRLMATRHVVFVVGLASPDEQRLTSEKFNRFAPPIVLATSGLPTFTRSVFPNLVADVERDYVPAGAVEQDDIRYLVLVRRDRPARGTYGSQHWPCFR